jgi:hypothetical protein
LSRTLRCLEVDPVDLGTRPRSPAKAHGRNSCRAHLDPHRERLARFGLPPAVTVFESADAWASVDRPF